MKKLIIDISVLPDIFLKVINVKTLLRNGDARDISEAIEIVGISRSTFYKYKDFIFEYEENVDFCE